MKKGKRISIVCLLVVLFLANTAFSAVQYEIIDLGIHDSWAQDINNNSQIIVSGLGRSYLYDNGISTDLGTLGGNRTDGMAINDYGQIVGQSWNSSNNMQAFFWENGVMTDLAPLQVFSAYDINNNGQVVALDYIWEKGGLYSNIPPPPNATSSLVAYAINDKGQITGNASIGGYQHSFIYDNGNWIDIGSLTGYDTFAVDINNKGQVTGDSIVGGVRHAFFWENGVMTDLGSLGGGRSQANAINNNGQAVGASYNSAGYNHAFLYERGMMTDLGTLDGHLYSQAIGINDLGQIVGLSIDGIGFSHAVLWNPVTIVPEPISSILFVTGGAMMVGRRYLKRKTT